MRRGIPAGVLIALALLVPAAPAAAQAETPGLNAACQTVERKLYKDIRELVTIDLDTATDGEVQLVGNQIMAAVRTDELPVLLPAIQKHLDGTAEDLRAFLKKGVYSARTADLRIAVGRTMTDAGANVQAAAQKALNSGTINASLAYLNEELYAARALDCASQPTPSASVNPSATSSVTPSVTPSATTTAAPVPTASASTDTPRGEGGGLAVTGADIGTVAGAGGALLLLGGAGYVIGRRRRSRFVA
jgi:LPXTG-motif cell wall-anchored protein